MVDWKVFKFDGAASGDLSYIRGKRTSTGNLSKSDQIGDNKNRVFFV